ncbi:mitochondrial amidoxime-reducing component 1-like [Saccoglossus kowalevskii]|uniref:MOSC domain-containing protein 1, mitochondrial-like n=1 Tax=Saccoglossus kowalevskii TaxID=10224 RepID=A0ABM0H1M5_SACKO|nr:PREDICTED: MOSC domain-containing protein 1, mitochondrial-like [Saccoglossus kowalevskii]
MSHSFFSREVVLGVLATCAGITVGAILYKSVHRKRVYKSVGTLSRIFVHPVKSCRGLQLQNAYCSKVGLVCGVLKDRHWIILNEENQFRGISHEPTMALISPTASEDGRYLLLDAPNMSRLEVPIDTNTLPEHERKTISFRLWRQNAQGKYCGAKAEQWLTQYFGKPMKLVHGDDDNLIRREIGKARPPIQLGEEGDCMVYQEDASYMLHSQASLADLNSKMQEPITDRNLRPNFVVSGRDAYDEDKWKYVKIGEVVLRRVKLDERCKVTTVDPETGIVSEKNEPIATLKTYRMCKEEDRPLYHNCPLFGVHYAIDVVGRVNIGDTVYVVYG